MKSKKQSGSSRKPLEPITFFIDRSLGKLAGQILRAAGAQVEFHDDHFSQEALDVEWLPTVGNKGWVVVTKDKRIRHRPGEREAVVLARIRMFVLASGKGLTGKQIGEMFANNLHRMEKLARKTPPPFIAGVYQNKIRLYDLPEK